MFNMIGVIDWSFTTNKVRIIRYANEYVDGIYVSKNTQDPEQRERIQYGNVQYQDGIAVLRPNTQIETEFEYRANVQPLNPRERRAIEEGGQRLLDARKIYINYDKTPKVFPSDRVEIDGLEGQYEIVRSDIRIERQYCKIIVSKVDQ